MYEPQLHLKRAWHKADEFLILLRGPLAKSLSGLRESVLRLVTRARCLGGARKWGRASAPAPAAHSGGSGNDRRLQTSSGDCTVGTGRRCHAVEWKSLAAPNRGFQGAAAWFGLPRTILPEALPLDADGDGIVRSIDDSTGNSPAPSSSLPR